jgi:RNA polymerase sigma factor (sigma-70 family)
MDVDAPGGEAHGREVTADAVEAILAARAALPEADERRDVLREHAVRTCLPLAERLAARYRRPHEGADELTQIVVGLLKAVDRFDPARGTGFLGFAFPTILGEIRRYSRDQTYDLWGAHHQYATIQGRRGPGSGKQPYARRREEPHLAEIETERQPGSPKRHASPDRRRCSRRALRRTTAGHRCVAPRTRGRRSAGSQ